MSVLTILLGAPGLFEAPTVAIKIVIAITTAVAAIVIALLLRPGIEAGVRRPVERFGLSAEGTTGYG